MLVNGLLGVVLWSTYTEASSRLEPYLASYPTTLAAISGGVAGGAQAILAAPAENMRFALEGTSRATGWHDAWKEVFRRTEPSRELPRKEQLHEARQVRDWMKEVGEMAGRGWEGWGWGCAKDICGMTTFKGQWILLHLWTDVGVHNAGFSVFFAIFDVTRRCALAAKTYAQELLEQTSTADKEQGSLRKHIPRIVHATSLVTGGAIAGLAYEVVCRPWDAARKAVHIDRLSPSGAQHSIPKIVSTKIRDDGMLSFFKNPSHVHHDSGTSPMRRRLNTGLRTLGGVGPSGGWVSGLGSVRARFIVVCPRI
ncbi:hypothetical protein BN946_scf185002.g70 [Trametes cinnabarina]|uniref:Uncharacterized protein n=1 Tax=Pycnoporus cinnabarinus TaxID=5643 RepID=A0A060SEV2_PYCCI|nr:hypothetical protein BN946_scf185002.g70 [Trametes cinnabarina]